MLSTTPNRFICPPAAPGRHDRRAGKRASRQIRAVPFGFDSVEIIATANNLKGAPLRGSPIRFVVTTK